MFPWAVFLWVGLALWLLYKKYTSVFRTWEERGIPFVPASFPFGSSSRLPLFREYPGYIINQMYKAQAGQPYFGIHVMRTPYLVLRDLDMVRTVLAKEFSHFRDRKGFDLPKKNSLANHLFSLEGERWRALRVKLSPTFTSGKLKGMYQHFIDCAEVLDKFLLSKADSVVDIKDITGRFNTDIICTCAFGMDVNSLDNENNPLRNIGKTVVEMNYVAKFFSSLMKTFPPIATFVQDQMSSGKMGKMMLNIIQESVNHREKHGLKRNDFLDLLIQLQKSKGTLVSEAQDNADGYPPPPIEITIELMTAQAFLFFFAGFETSSSVQSYCLYELALQPEIQDRVRKEIEEVISKHGGLTYQAIQSMDYLDMVVSETMRKYPTLSNLTRRCTKSFTTPSGHKILKGDNIWIPTWSLHHDPEHFPNPEKFDPERFSPENKNSIKPFSYLPFGEGPRICIGMRFGQLQTKMGLITVLRKFRVSPSPETPIPLRHGVHTSLSPPDRPILLNITNIRSLS